MPACLARALAVVVVLVGATACSENTGCDDPPCAVSIPGDVGPVDDASDAEETGSLQPDAPADVSASHDASDGG